MTSSGEGFSFLSQFSNKITYIDVVVVNTEKCNDKIDIKGKGCITSSKFGKNQPLRQY